MESLAYIQEISVIECCEIQRETKFRSWTELCARTFCEWSHEIAAFSSMARFFLERSTLHSGRCIDSPRAHRLGGDWLINSDSSTVQTLRRHKRGHRRSEGKTVEKKPAHSCGHWSRLEHCCGDRSSGRCSRGALSRTGLYRCHLEPWQSAVERLPQAVIILPPSQAYQRRTAEPGPTSRQHDFIFAVRDSFLANWSSAQLSIG
mmetsp:Transcript_12483/g.38085  ORF Transcript_12483/g.38085 Transcript_12483/m.38085 type:complete len:204 (+) Transcript_12483:437-1048(+)